MIFVLSTTTPAAEKSDREVPRVYDELRLGFETDNTQISRYERFRKTPCFKESSTTSALTKKRRLMVRWETGHTYQGAR